MTPVPGVQGYKKDGKLGLSNLVKPQVQTEPSDDRAVLRARDFRGPP